MKVKVGDKMLYKTKTITRDLNPVWDESFVLPICDLNQHVLFKVTSDKGLILWIENDIFFKKCKRYLIMTGGSKMTLWE